MLRGSRVSQAQLLWDRAMASWQRARAGGPRRGRHRRQRPSESRADSASARRARRHDVVVLLPWDRERPCGDLAVDLADAVFGLDARPGAGRCRLPARLRPRAPPVRTPA
jgi:hypothetical protein